MWHEARKREKATHRLFNDFKKHAEKKRREDRVDPNSLLQIHGLKSKLSIEPSVYKQAIKSLVAWQGDKNVTIDRFDVRATLTSIPKEKSQPRDTSVLDIEESLYMKKLINYERYRLLIQNDLNKVPEELRLKLVAKSDVASDAKLKKLSYNKFGTSGEASVSYNQTHPSATIFNRHMQGREQSERGAAISHSYNSVPPPACLTDPKGEDEIKKIQDIEDNTSRNKLLKIVDEIDGLELDSVAVAQVESKKLNDIAKKYGLTGDELLLLTQKDNQELGSAQLLKELIKLNKNKDKAEQESQSVYGPALPPGLINNQIASSSDENDQSPVQQRSPSGGDIPLRSRNGHKEDSSDSDKSPKQVVQKSSSEKTVVGSSSQASSTNNIPYVLESDELKKTTQSPNSEHSIPDAATCVNETEKTPVEDRSRSSKRELSTSRTKARRAPTPLAYKRNCRSSRSLSRERKTNRRLSNHRKSSRKRRHKSRSRSRSSTSLSLSSNSSSYSCHSSRSSSPRRRESSNKSNRTRMRSRR